MCGNQKTHVFFDACHLIKLVRKTLHAYKYLMVDGKTISWQLIADLHEIQESVGLRLGNKLTSKHIAFQQQKMKVSLATQLLSSSVANALWTMKGTDTRFDNCDATADFLEVFK